MTDDRRNIKVGEDVFERLNDERQDRGLSWPAFLDQLHEDAIKAEALTNEIRRLREDLDDVVTDRVERIVAREVEAALDRHGERLAEDVADELAGRAR